MISKSISLNQPQDSFNIAPEDKPISILKQETRLLKSTFFNWNNQLTIQYVQEKIQIVYCTPFAQSFNHGVGHKVVDGGSLF